MVEGIARIGADQLWVRRIDMDRCLGSCEQVSVPMDQRLEGSTVSVGIQCVDLGVKIQQQVYFRIQSIPHSDPK